MSNEYVEDLKKNIENYYYTYPNIDYVSILITCCESLKNVYNQDFTKEELLLIKNNILSIILDLSVYISKYDFKYYLSLIKKLEIYKYKDNHIFKLLLKYFPSLSIIWHCIKYKQKMFSKYNKSVEDLRHTKHIILYPKKNLHPRKLYIPYVELVVTTKCTLRCKNCANLMHRYESPYDVDFDTIIKSIDKITACCSEISIFRILGGEPFCNKNLKYIINRIPKPKVRHIVIVTNGTILPNDMELVDIIKKKNVLVEISDYSNYSYKKYEIINFFNENAIDYRINRASFWYDYGELKNYNRPENELKSQFTNCKIICRSILNGCLYYCPRAAHGYDLGVIKRNQGEYVNLLKNSDRKNKKEVAKLLKRKYNIEACKYCLYATLDCKLINVAEQLPKKT